MNMYQRSADMRMHRAGSGTGLQGGNVGHAISIYDVVSDTVHQFAPAYHDYVLYRYVAPAFVASVASFVGGDHWHD